MPNKYIIFFFIFIFFGNLKIFSQTNMGNDLDFLATKISTVYAGYSEKIKQKDFSEIIRNVKKSEIADTFANLSKLTSFFKDHHLSLFQLLSKKDIDTIICKKNAETIFKYANSYNKKRKYEGYWLNELNNSIIYLKYSKDKSYEGFLIESNYSIPTGFCILKFEDIKSKKILTDYKNFEFMYRTFTYSFFKSPNTLVVSSYSKWKKINNYYKGILKDKNEIKLRPSLNIIDSNNLLIKMPDFNVTSLRVYDSLILANGNIIRKTKNLIIDIRNNGGGVTNCFLKIIPYIWTNSIFKCQGLTLSSEDVISDAKERRDKYIKRKDSVTVKEFDSVITKLDLNRGKLILGELDTIKFTPVENTVQNVALLINHGCRSAAELMILYFKQSNKVKVFGEHSAGAIDYLNMLTYSLPVSKFVLWVGTVKRQTSPSQPLYDESGIKPDIEISDDETDWVDFVKRYYGKN